MEIKLLQDIAVIFALAVGVLYLFHHLRLPAIIGFFLTGVVAGPHGLGLISQAEQVSILAEVGVVVLLFTIGLEFSLKDLLQLKKVVLLGGGLQVGLTSLAGGLLAGLLGYPTNQAVFIGMLVSLSSTVIIMRSLQQTAQLESPHGRVALGISIFQDIATVPMMLLLPLLSGDTEQHLGRELLVMILKGLLIIVVVIVAAKLLIPRLLYRLARTRNRELFLLAVVVICLAVAWMTNQMGLSLPLGAFLAGLIISESEYSHQAFGNILPFRDVFTSVFFISIGMLLNLGQVIHQPALVVGGAIIIISLKALIAGGVTLLLGRPLRTAVQSGLILSQVGEFSFILALVGIEQYQTAVQAGAQVQQLITPETYQYFLAISILSMAVTPLLFVLGPRLANQLLRLPLPGRLKADGPPRVVPATFKDHIIIIGYGLNGQNLARAARAANLPYFIIETNPDTVRKFMAQGEPIYFGDAIHPSVLEHAHVVQARVLVIAINDPVAVRRITESARRLNPGIYIIVRTRFLPEIAPLRQLGADEVVPEEFETSVEIFTRVLERYLVPHEEIERFTAGVRADTYQMLRAPAARAARDVMDLPLHLPGLEVATFRLTEASPLAGQSLAQIDLRRKFGLALLAIQRAGETILNPAGDIVLARGDLLIMLGPPEKFPAFSERLHTI